MNEISLYKRNNRYFRAFFSYCQRYGWYDVWLGMDIFMLITSLPVNAALLFLFLKERKSLSASKVLGVNLVLMDLLYLLLLPIGMACNINNGDPFNGNDSDDFDIATVASRLYNNTDSLDDGKGVISMINLIGIPLLLTCMCVERYLAVVKPVMYLRLRKWEYRMAVSAVVWVIMLLFTAITAFLADLVVMMLPTAIIISCLFLIMLASLWGVIWSLRQKSSAHTTCSSHAPLKRRALVNVLVVVVPAVVAYFPVLLMVPVMSYIVSSRVPLTNNLCWVFELSLLFPSLGLFIGPLFFLSKARHMCCRSRRGKTNAS